MQNVWFGVKNIRPSHFWLYFYGTSANTNICLVYQYEPQALFDSSAYSMYWNWQVLTDRHIPHNKPDVLLADKMGRFTYIIDVANPHYSNIERKYVEKKVNYEPR